MDCATLLQIIAGVDGLDDRQIAGTPFPADVPNYPKILEQTADKGVKGLKIGVVKEAFFTPYASPAVRAKFFEAVEKFRELGAIIEEVSIPIHTLAPTIYGVVAKLTNYQGMMGRATSRRLVMMTDLYEKKNLPYTQESLSKMSSMSLAELLISEYGWQNYTTVYPKAMNLVRKIKDAYDAALEKVDILVMPTCVTPAVPLPPVDVLPLGFVEASKGKLENAQIFSASGHPALAMPIGLVEPIVPDGDVKLPASMQLVGRYWEESMLLRAAYAFERAVDWKTF
jgi:amidase